MFNNVDMKIVKKVDGLKDIGLVINETPIGVIFLNKRDIMALATSEGNIVIYNFSKNKTVKVISHFLSFRAITNLNDDVFICSDYVGNILFVSIEDTKIIKKVNKGQNFVWCLQKIDEFRFVSGGNAGTLLLWDIRKFGNGNDGMVKDLAKGKLRGYIFAVGVSKMKKDVIYVGGDFMDGNMYAVCKISLSTGNVMKTFSHHDFVLRDIFCFSRNHKEECIVSVDCCSVIKVWNDEQILHEKNFTEATNRRSSLSRLTQYYGNSSIFGGYGGLFGIIEIKNSGKPQFRELNEVQKHFKDEKKCQFDYIALDRRKKRCLVIFNEVNFIILAIKDDVNREGSDIDQEERKTFLFAKITSVKRLLIRTFCDKRIAIPIIFFY